MGGAAALLAPRALAASPSRLPLFAIARSKNKNTVQYDLLAGGPEPQLDVYWRMHERSGEREELTGLEWRLAYGYRVEERAPSGALRITLRAFQKRVVDVVTTPDGARAEVEIGGVRAQLDRIFVTSVEGFPLPRVVSVDLFGRALEGGAPVTERLVP